MNCLLKKIRILGSIILLIFPILSMDKNIVKPSQDLTVMDACLIFRYIGLYLPKDVINYIGQLMLGSSLDYNNLINTEFKVDTQLSTTTGGFSPDSKSILLCSYDGTVCLCDAQSGKVHHKHKRHTNWICSGCFSSDGKKILTCGADGNSYISDAQSGELLFALPRFETMSFVGCFSPDCKTILTCTFLGEGFLWDAQDGRQLCQLEDCEGIGLIGCFSPNGKILLTNSLSQYGYLRDVQSGKPLDQQLEGHQKKPDGKFAGCSGCFSPDGKMILLYSPQEGAIFLWDAQSKKLVYKVNVTSDGIKCACFSPDSTTILICSQNGMCFLMDVRSGKIFQEFKKNNVLIKQSCFSPDGKTILIFLRKPKNQALFLQRSFCEASQSILDDSSLLQMWFVSYAEKTKRAGISWEISDGSNEYLIFQSFSEEVKAYIQKWFTVYIVDLSKDSSMIEDKNETGKLLTS